MSDTSAKPLRARFDRVSLSFETSKGLLQVVDDVTYDINNGDFIAVIGPSGCGKTTMMSMLAGFQKPTTGQVLFDGAPVNGPGPERGVIFQEYGVFPWLTVRENIAFGLKLGVNRVSAAERDNICTHYLSLMGLYDFANAYQEHSIGHIRLVGAGWVWAISVPMAMPDWAEGCSNTFAESMKEFAGAWARLISETPSDRLERIWQIALAAEARAAIAPKTS